MKKDIMLYLVSLLIFLIIWQASVSLLDINRVLFPAPLDVMRSFIAADDLLMDSMASVTRLLFGAALGIVSGISYGLLTGKSEIFNKTTGNISNFFRFIPPLALIPLFLVWFGISELSKILVLAWTVFFPVWISTHNGIGNIEKKYLLLAKSLAVRPFYMIKEIILKGTLPYILNGARIGIGVGFSVLVAAEMLGAFSGLGYRIFFLQSVYRIDLMVGYIIFIGIIGIAFDRIFLFASKKLVWWKNGS
jgi:NitT/TauT family transport system permease protein